MLDKRRVAVLPFVNMSPDPQDEFFADGLTEELIDRLSQVRELEVIARTSVMSYKKKEKKAAEIGKELKAGVLVEGSLRKAGNMIRVTAQLIDANTEGHLWSSRYDRNLEDIFQVQSDIAEKVTDSLRIQLLPEEKKAIEKKTTESTDAYALYLKGRHYWKERSEEGLRKAITYFQLAIEIDPKFALAYALLSDTYSVQLLYGYVPSEEVLLASRKFAEKALQLDDSVSEAHEAYAFVLANELKWNQAEAEIRKALELNPNNASAHHRYAFGLMRMGDAEAALEEIRKAKQLDPLSPIINDVLGDFLRDTGRYDEAIKELEEALKLIPDHSGLLDSLGFALIKASRVDEGISKLQKAVTLSDNDYAVRADLAVGYALSGRKVEATRILDELLELKKVRYASPLTVAWINAALGGRDEAMRWLEIARRERAPDLFSILGSRVFADALGTDPRFLAMIEEMRKG